MFEIGKIYSIVGQEESYSSFILLTGRCHGEMYSEEKKTVYDLFDIKGLVESMMTALGVTGCSVRRTESLIYKSGTAMQFMMADNVLATLGELSETFTKGMRIRYGVFGAQIDIDKIVSIIKNKNVVRYQPIPVYPSTTRDIALSCDENMESETIIDCIRSVRCGIIENVELFDLYQDKSLGTGKKSMAYSITYRCPDRTLTDDEVNKTHEKIRSELVSKLSVELR